MTSKRQYVFSAVFSSIMSLSIFGNAIVDRMQGNLGLAWVGVGFGVFWAVVAAQSASRLVNGDVQ